MNELQTLLDQMVDQDGVRVNVTLDQMSVTVLAVMIALGIMVGIVVGVLIAKYTLK